MTESSIEEALRTWRLLEARRRGVPAFRIFSDQRLRAIAQRRPAKAAELLALPGIGISGREISLNGKTTPQCRWLTQGESQTREPVYSPDGEWVLFTSNRSGNLDLWELSTKSGALRRITDDPADDWDPAFTADGTKIIWSSNRSGHHMEIWISDADGSGARQVTNDGKDAENPTATRDGQWIVHDSRNPNKLGL